MIHLYVKPVKHKPNKAIRFSCALAVDVVVSTATSRSIYWMQIIFGGKTNREKKRTGYLLYSGNDKVYFRTCCVYLFAACQWTSSKKTCFFLSWLILTMYIVFAAGITLAPVCSLAIYTSNSVKLQIYKTKIELIHSRRHWQRHALSMSGE